MQAQQTLRNEGYGAAEGFSVNMTFLAQEGDRMFHNAEVGPVEAGADRSQLSILTVSPGENTSHCNKYMIPTLHIDLHMNRHPFRKVTRLSSCSSKKPLSRLLLPFFNCIIAKCRVLKKSSNACSHIRFLTVLFSSNALPRFQISTSEGGGSGKKNHTEQHQKNGSDFEASAGEVTSGGDQYT